MGVMIFDHSATFDTIDGRTSLKDIVSTNSILVKVGFHNLNEMVASQTTLLILCSKMKILWVESHDFSQAEKDKTEERFSTDLI